MSKLRDRLKTKNEVEAKQFGRMAACRDLAKCARLGKAIESTKNPYGDPESKLYQIWDLSYWDKFTVY